MRRRRRAGSGSATIGALGLARAVDRRVGATAARWPPGSRLTAAGPRAWAKVWTFCRVEVVWANVPGRSATARLTLASWEAKARKTFALAAISETIWGCFWATAVLRRCSELISC